MHSFYDLESWNCTKWYNTQLNISGCSMVTSKKKNKKKTRIYWVASFKISQGMCCCFVSNVLQAFFFRVTLVFLHKKFSWSSNLKIYNNFAYFWHFFRCVKGTGFCREYVKYYSPNCWWYKNTPVLGNRFISVGNLYLCNIFLEKSFCIYYK